MDSLEALRLALEAAGLRLVDPALEQKIADDIEWAADIRASLSELRSAELANRTIQWMSKVWRFSGELASCLEAPPGNAAIHLERASLPDGFKPYEIISSAELVPILRALERAARSACKAPDFGKVIVRESKGFSATDNFILMLGDIFEAATGQIASVQRTSADGDKGGEFPRFVSEVARCFGQKRPSVHAVAKALPKRDIFRERNTFQTQDNFRSSMEE